MRKLLALALLVTFAFAACAAQAQGVKLAYKFKAGEIDKYKLAMKMTFSIAGMAQVNGPKGPMEMNMSVIMRQKTLGVYPDGSAKIAFSCGEPQVRIVGMPTPPKPKTALKSPAMTVTLATDGSVRKIDGLAKTFAFNGAGGSGFSAEQFNQFVSFMGQSAVFPSTPLQVGQTWDSSVPLPFGDAQIKVCSALMSDNAAVGKTRAAQVQQTFDGSLDLAEMFRSIAGMLPAQNPGRDAVSGISGAMDIFGSMDYYFSPTLGKMLKGKGEMVMNMKMAMPEQLVKMGAPPQIDITANATYDLTKL